MPITWRNVDAPSFGESNRLMQSGLDAITGGLQNTSDAITENWDRVKQQNTDRYAAEIMAAQDMDAVANLRASLTPDQLNGRYEGQIDTVGLMGALQDQGRFVRQDTMEQKQFEDFNETRNWRDQIADVLITTRSDGADAGRQAKQNLLDAGAPQWLVTELADSIYNQGRQENQDKMSLEQHGWNRASAARQATEHSWKAADRITQEKERLKLNGFESQRNQIIRNNPNATPQEIRELTNRLADEFGVNEEIRLASLQDIPTVMAANWGGSEEHRANRENALSLASRETLFENWKKFTEENPNTIPDEETMKSWGNDFYSGIADKDSRNFAEENYTDLVRILNQVPQEQRAAQFEHIFSFEQAWEPVITEAAKPVTEITNQINNLLYQPQKAGEGAKSPGDAMWGLLNELGLKDDAKTRYNIDNSNFSKNYLRVYESVSDILEGANEFDIQRVVNETFKATIGEVSEKDRKGVTFAGSFTVAEDLINTLNGREVDYKDLLERVIPQMTERYIREKELYPELEQQLQSANSYLNNVRARQQIDRTLQFGSRANN